MLVGLQTRGTAKTAHETFASAHSGRCTRNESVFERTEGCAHTYRNQTQTHPHNDRSSRTVVDQNTLCDQVEYDAAVFKTGDKTQLKQIYDTFANTVEFDHFERMYKEAVAQPHGFLFIDTVPKKEYKRFCSSFNYYLV